MEKIQLKNSLRLFLGIIFGVAAIGRIIFFKECNVEFTRLGLGIWANIVTIVVELLFSVSFILNKYLRSACVLLMLLLLAGMAIALPQVPISGLYTIFFFSPSPENLLVHFIYLGLVVLLLIEYTQHKSDNKK